MSIVSLPTLHFRWDHGNLLQLHCVCQKAQAEEDQRFVNHLDLSHEDDEIFKEHSPATAGEWVAANPERFQWLQVPYLVKVDPVRSLGEILGEGRSRPMPAEVTQRIEELATAPEEAEAQKPEQHWAHNAPETRALIRGKIFYANVDDFTKQCLNFMAQLERERDAARAVIKGVEDYLRNSEGVVLSYNNIEKFIFEKYGDSAADGENLRDLLHAATGDYHEI